MENDVKTDEQTSTDPGDVYAGGSDPAQNNSLSSSDGKALDGTPKTGALKDYFAYLKQFFKRLGSFRFSAAYVAKMAILTAISFLLYYLGRFVKLPFMFPSFLDMQISELPALLAGFSLGPISGCLVIVFKCLLKLPLSSTFYVGELTDILLGISFVLPASLIYRLRRDKSNVKSGVAHALIGLAVGSVALTAISLVVNRYISVPFYVEMFFQGDFEKIIRMLSTLYKKINGQNFYAYYLLLGVLPFNLLRCIIVSVLTFLLYKRLSVLLHWEGDSLLKKKVPSIFGAHQSHCVEDTYSLAAAVAGELDGGEVILLDGDLGAGKTTFTKGLAKALGVTEEVTSPTFAIMNVYESGRLRLNHIDMYRIQSEDEIAELGIEDSFDPDSVTVIEWNKLRHLDGKIYHIQVSAGDDENSRVFTVSEGDPKDIA